MEFIIGIAILAGIAWLVYAHFTTESSKSDSPAAPYKVEPTLTTKIDEIEKETLTTKIDGIGHETVIVPVETSVLDLNQDGKVDMKDAIVAVEKTKAKAKEVVEEVKTVAKKTAAKAKKVEEAVVAEVKKAKAKKPKVPKA